MRLRIKVQRHLAAVNIDGDDGDWVFTVCRSGFSKMLGYKLLPGREYIAEVSGHVIKESERATS